jgi:hypothetical protein
MSEALNLKAIESMSKKCPGCRMPIEKNDGRWLKRRFWPLASSCAICVRREFVFTQAATK